MSQISKPEFFIKKRANDFHHWDERCQEQVIEAIKEARTLAKESLIKDIINELEKVAYDPTYHKYNVKDANQAIRRIIDGY